MCRLTLFLAALLCLPAAQGRELGKLFFTPAERAALDRERQRSGMPEGAAPQGGVTPDNLTLDGYVRRSGGRSTVWINGQPQYSRDASPPVRITEKSGSAGQVWVSPPDAARSFPLKAGQVLTPASGEIRERYQLAPAPAPPPPVSTPSQPGTEK